MYKKYTYILFALILCLPDGIMAQSVGITNATSSMDKYMTIKEAMASLPIPDAAGKPATNLGKSPEIIGFLAPPYTSIAPVRLFDNFYFVGTTAVGSFIIDTGDGLVMLDTGCGDEDCAMMVADMKKIGLDPSKIKLILLSHEHFDHYGGVQYLKREVCPGAKVAMSLIGWNMLQTVPLEGPYIGTRPPAVDIYLTDGMKIKVGVFRFQVVSTPGHSPGCVSFIIPVTDQGEPHVVGIMGGSAVFPTQTETRQYKASIEYFKAFATVAGCDIGLYFHSAEETFAALRVRKPGEPNPLVLGRTRFDSEYLKSFRERYWKMLASPELKPY
jgi:metallo-beta-lactamase class B